MLLQGDAPSSSPTTEPASPDIEDDAPGTAEPGVADGALARALVSLRAHASLADGMRLVGTLLLVAGLSTFLMAGVEVRNDLHRFALLLAQTATFTGVAFALARWLEDLRGARLLFGVAALSVPAAFTVLGAMVYSMVAWDAPSASPETFMGQPALIARDMPAFAHWQLGSANELFVAAATAVVTLVPTVYFALAVLARHSAARLGGATLATSLFLLVPVRDPAWAGALVLGSAVIAVAVQYGLAKRDVALRTVGGRFARALPFVPAFVIAARTVLVDGTDDEFLLFGALTLLGLMRLALVATGPASRLHAVLLPLGVVFAATVMTQMLDMVQWRVLPDAALMLPFAGVALVMLDFTRLTQASRTVCLVENLWAVGLLLTAALCTLAARSATEAVLTLVMPAIAVMVLAAWRGRVWLGALGGLACAWGLGWFAGSAFDWMKAHAWQSMAALGLATVVGASLVQRYGPVAAARVALLRRRYGGSAASAAAKA